MDSAAPALDLGPIPTRAAGLERLREFVPRAGRRYAATRNFDFGPRDRGNVSGLSPYLRTRLLSEADVLAAVLERHSLASAEKFVAEVFWRTYWKGWLEAHPAAWTRYVAARADALAGLAAQADRRAAYDRAVAGATGIDAFDAWVTELRERGYLHNHARMWFASIWIFTLELPWELGADLFMRELLDGDPASNTLSWRWVAGLHTRGKTYAATRANIRRYTGERFALDMPLARSPRPLDDAPISLAALPVLVPAAEIAGPTLLAVHDDDLHGDARELPPDVRGVCAFDALDGRSPLPVSTAVREFTAAAARDAVAGIVATTGAAALDLDLGSGFGAQPGADAGLGRAIVAAARACGARTIVVPYAPIGPVRDRLGALRSAALAAGLAYAEIGRRYDAVSWPAATRGFFNLRTRIPAIVAELGLGAG